MSGLANICKLYGKMTTKSKGKTVEWIYDYKLDKPRLKSEMTKKELAENEKLRKEL